MEDFFKLMNNVAKSDNRKYTSILELTKDIALSAGYNLENYTQKNGKVRERVAYTKSWDNALVAKWFLFYKNYFKSKLYTLPALREYHTQILNRTFQIYFNALRLDKLTSDKAITAYVKLAFSNRIGEAIYCLGSLNKIKENEERRQLRRDIKNGLVEDKPLKDTKNRCRIGSSFNENALSLNQLQEDSHFDVESTDLDISSVLIDLKSILADNSIGLRLLDSMLYSGKKIIFNNLCNYMEFNKNELQEKDGIIDFKDSIKDQLMYSYHTIVSYLGDIFPSIDFSKTKRVFKYSSKNDCTIYEGSVC